MKTRTEKLLLGASIAALLTSFAAPAVYAQDTDAVEDDDGSGDVITVTGQRREQSDLDVPISSTVFSDEYLTKRNFDDAKDFLLETPNVTFSQGGRNGAREIVIAIRGISDLKGGEKVITQSAFSTYWDGFAPGQLASGQPNLPIYDMASVEVLRGPQGVFFGRNSEGGAINYVSKKPEDEYYGRIDAGISRFNTYQLAGVVNVPISETLFARLTAYGTKTDGPLKNAHPVGGDTGSEFAAFRGQLRWQPTDQTTFDLAINHTIDNQDLTPKLSSCVNTSTFGLPVPVFGADGVLGGIGCYDANGEFSSRVMDGTITLPAGLTLADIPDNRTLLYQDTLEHTDIETDIVTLNINHNLTDTIVFSSVTGLAKSDMDQFLDLDHSGIKAINRFGTFESHSWSQEVRIGQYDASKLDWTIGGIYYNEDFTAVNQILIEQVLGPWVPGDKANENVINNNLSGWAVFANFEYHLLDNLSLIAGGRYSHDEGTNTWDEVYAACGRRTVDPMTGAIPALSAGCELTRDQQQAIDNLGGLPQYPNRAGGLAVTGGRNEQLIGRFASNSGDDFSPRVAINFNPTETTSLYASVSKGYKPGGGIANPDGGVLGGVSILDKETLWNYEIGGTAYLFDYGLRLSGAVFYMDWNDYQIPRRETFCQMADGSFELTILVPDLGVCTAQLQVDRTSNAPKARSKGAEFSFQARPVDSFQFGGAVGYLDAKYVEGTTIVGGGEFDLADVRIGAAPKWTLSANAQYDFPAFGGDAYIRGDWSYRSDGAGGLVSQATDRFPTRQDAFGLLGFSVGQTWGRHTITANVDNVLNNEYFTGTDGFSFGGVQLTYNPRTWSVRWTAEFGPEL